MSRKGQYMAVEAVLSLGLSLIVALAAVTVFGSYRDSVLDDIQDRNVQIASSEIISSLHNLGSMGSGSSISVDLPKTGNGREYQVSMDSDQLEIRSGGSEYTYPIESVNWPSEYRGSAQGKSFRIVRINGLVEVRAQ